METKMSVRDLRISFRTSNGKVQAVRGINFDLAKGETLAIVGESGSGKSVTSKAILGIQAANAITESGEIIYDGKDLLKINEEEFHKIRGDKIAMIFQDPMSSLNPIVKIGKQLTEAMILKGKARQRESKQIFNTYLKELSKAMVAAGDPAQAEALAAKCKNFDKFEFKHIELESAYNTAHEAAVEALADIESIAFEMEKKSVKAGADRIKDIAARAKASCNEYVVKEKAERIKELAGGLKGQFSATKKTQEYGECLKSLYEIQEILKEAVDKKVPDFFRLGYYLTFANQPIPEMDVDALNEYLLKYLDDSFMLAFIADAKKALQYTAAASYKDIEEAIAVLKENKAVFAKEKLDKKECMEAFKVLVKEVEETIDPLSITKDSLTYTFASSLKGEIDTYFDAIVKNVKAEKVHDRDQKKHDKLVAKGKTPDWEVAAAAVIDLELVKAEYESIDSEIAAMQLALDKFNQTFEFEVEI